MAASDKVKALLASAGSIPECVEARTAWVEETSKAWREAQRRMDERLGEAVVRLSEEAFERLFDEEQAKVDALREPVMRAAREDKWPRALHAKGL